MNLNCFTTNLTIHSEIETCRNISNTIFCQAFISTIVTKVCWLDSFHPINNISEYHAIVEDHVVWCRKSIGHTSYGHSFPNGEMLFFWSLLNEVICGLSKQKNQEQWSSELHSSLFGIAWPGLTADKTVYRVTVKREWLETELILLGLT